MPEHGTAGGGDGIHRPEVVAVHVLEPFRRHVVAEVPVPVVTVLLMCSA